MNLQLKDKVIMVAAGSKGLGFSIAQSCAKEGAIVSIASRNQANVDHAVEELSALGTSVHGATIDVRNKGSIQGWADAVLSTYGRIDGLVVNAGGPPAGRFDDFEEEDWYNAFELTLMSAVRMIRAVLPTMRKQKQGSIIAITSLSIKEPIDTILLSNVMRSGVASLVKSLSKDLIKQGIRINNLVPGIIYTDRIANLNRFRATELGISVEEYQATSQANIPAGRYGTVEEFGAAGAFLLSNAASYINGATLVIDGGQSKTVW